MKDCNRCGTSKPVSEFYRDKSKKDGLTTKCKECSKTFRSSTFRDKIEKFCPRCTSTLPVDCFDLSPVGDGYQTACKTCRNLVKRVSKYKDFDWQKFHEMMEAQNGLCKICNRPEILVIDHCHKTEKVRGLICQPCNIGLGGFKDNEAVMIQAIQYLRESKGLPRLK